MIKVDLLSMNCSGENSGELPTSSLTKNAKLEEIENIYQTQEALGKNILQRIAMTFNKDSMEGRKVRLMVSLFIKLYLSTDSKYNLVPVYLESL